MIAPLFSPNSCLMELLPVIAQQDPHIHTIVNDKSVTWMLHVLLLRDKKWK